MDEGERRMNAMGAEAGETVCHAMRVPPHVDFANACGLAETSSMIVVLGAEDHREAMASGGSLVRRRLESVGRPLPTLELDIRDETGVSVPQGEPGEIWVRGEQVSGEYVGALTRREDGWFPTNDAGWMDAGAFLYGQGRLDDVIVRGGEAIAPGEIEEVRSTRVADHLPYYDTGKLQRPRMQP